jgi:hypothetical protein
MRVRVQQLNYFEFKHERRHVPDKYGHGNFESGLQKTKKMIYWTFFGRFHHFVRSDFRVKRARINSHLAVGGCFLAAAPRSDEYCRPPSRISFSNYSHK